MVSNVIGTFSKVSGSVDYDGKSLDKASVEAEIGSNSINTNVSERDQHVRNAMAASTYPLITFRSSKITPHPDGRFDIYGTLSMRGVSNTVVLNAEPLSTMRDQAGRECIETTATTSLNRKEFGITIDRAIDHGGAMVGDKVNITLKIILLRK